MNIVDRSRASVRASSARVGGGGRKIRPCGKVRPRTPRRFDSGRRGVDDVVLTVCPYIRRTYVLLSPKRKSVMCLFCLHYVTKSMMRRDRPRTRTASALHPRVRTRRRRVDREHRDRRASTNANASSCVFLAHHRFSIASAAFTEHATSIRIE